MKKMFFSIFLFVICSAFLVACTEPNQEETISNDYEDVEVQLDILENIETDNSSLLKITVINNSNEMFNGTATVKLGFESWAMDVLDLPPGEKTEQQYRHKYIKHPEDGYTYSFDGNLADKGYSSDIEYKINEVSSNAYEVQMEDLNKENVFEVMKEIYSKHGNTIVHVGFFDNSVDIDNRDPNVDFPKAEYWGKPDNEKHITIGSEKFDFEP